MAIRILIFNCVVLLQILSPGAAESQQALQSPDQFLGYDLGDQFTPHHRIISYMRHVAEQSERVILHQYGTTYERRELVYLIVTTPENLSNIEEIRMNNLRMTRLEDGEPSELQKAIIWLSYNVHGNEASGSEAAMKTLYELADPSNVQTERWLENSVVIIDPMLNPDGRDRYVNWYNQMEGSEFNPLIDAREHHEPWPGGRSNHYYFDLNRDWAWQTQTETQQRIKIYRDWIPHVHVDFHEQWYYSPYYFAPAAEPFHNAITEWQSEFQTIIGMNHMKYFDEEGWLYFTREVFDLFYPSYGDTWPTFNGAIGMTYEQAGHSLAGRGIITPEGDTLTLKDRMTRHHIAGMSTVELTSQQVRRVISEFRSHFHRAVNNPDGQYKTFVIKADNHLDKIYALLKSLDDDNIRYGRSGSSRNIDGYNYQTGRTERLRVEENDILISAFQPQSQLVRVLFEPNPELSDSLTYDITAWESHYRFGLEGYALTARMEPGENIAPDDYHRYNEIGNTEEPYAYIIPWKSMEDARFLAEILDEGVQVRFSRVPFTIDNRKYDKGTLIITRTGNTIPDFDDIVTTTAQKYARQVHRAETGFVTAGSDFGSANIRIIEVPRIAVLTGEETSSTSTGEVWHFFDQQLQYPATLINARRFSDTELNRFNVLVLPEGGYNDILHESAINRIQTWVQNGGRLIAIGSANRELADKSSFNLSMKSAENPEQDDPESLLNSFADRDREAVQRTNRGSVYRITLDPTHPLAFGYGEEYFSLKLDTNTFSYMDDGWNVGVAKPDAHFSGFVGHEAKSSLEHTLTFGVQQMGSGAVVYLIDNPLFRGFWENGKLLFVNAVFLVGQ
jgi:hypothetical protein